ncbi:hypothetical protein [Thalassotalea marina]|uniref:Uncharacterized protein n=1 Tax=Thalassotalea marina TaxID=1673741 RepID=A0A919BCW6_9GAMM|nr:hypothetical protein [Thalassotalea marina]GHF80419.1 hypothetical protein GCM10017161_04630 [Thalassotalea marina]
MVGGVDLKTISQLVIYGAGAASQQLVEYFQLQAEQYSICTTHGGEGFLNKTAAAFSTLPSGEYHVVIASQYFYEIYCEIKRSTINVAQVYCYNNVNNTVLPVESLLRQVKPNKTLYAVYDLEMNPASFDVCVFANAAEYYRREQGFDNIHFVVVPPILKYGRLCDASFYNQGAEQSFRERIEKLLVPILSLIPSKIGCSVLAHREEAEALLHEKALFPKLVDLNRPKDTHNPVALLPKNIPIGYFTADIRSSKFVEDMFGVNNQPLITVTLREYLDQPKRNNDIDELVKFLTKVENCGFVPVIIRDTANCGKKAIEKLAKYQSFSNASLDIGIRMALYERAAMNFFVNNGPVALASFNHKVNYMVFKLVDESLLCTTQEFFRLRYAIDERDSQYFWAQHKQQKIFWQPDTCDFMWAAFKTYLDKKNDL